MPSSPTKSEAQSSTASPASPSSPVQVLTDTRGVNFAPYLERVVATVKKNWYQLIPSEAMPPLLKRGKVVMEFAIMKDGQVSALRYNQTSGDVAFDRAAYGGITASSPFAPLPSEFKGPYLGLRFSFFYNPQPGEYQASTSPVGSTKSALEKPVETARLSEILISTGPVGSADSQKIAAARTKAEGLLAQLRTGGSFEQLAKTTSDDASSVFGGDLGYFQRGKLAKSIEEVVFAMKPGEISDVIRTKQGFIILKVTEHRGAPQDSSKPSTN